ncbi:MAG: hypothetical protein JEZ05_06540 [Tenericutes bacterium]|nr:hypothetical protein [Mycoplasmatota bacterium]MBI9009674.1 hypothetical protein [Mycoplasmatota bacterium]
MELIPILSLIVLTATVSTFILAVGAYILYKIRERKGQTLAAPRPEAVEAELVAPAPMVAEQRHTQSQPLTRKTMYEESRPTMTGSRGTRMEEERMRRGAGPQTRQTFVQTSTSGRFSETGEYFDPHKKFMRYTQDGYQDTSDSRRTTQRKEDKLKWR